MSFTENLYLRKQLQKLQEENQDLKKLVNESGLGTMLKIGYKLSSLYPPKISNENEELAPDPEATKAIELGKTMRDATGNGNFQSPGMTPQERERRREQRGTNLKMRDALSKMNPFS